jgi:hypothetical protein
LNIPVPITAIDVYVNCMYPFHSKPPLLVKQQAE